MAILGKILFKLIKQTKTDILNTVCAPLQTADDFFSTQLLKANFIYLLGIFSENSALLHSGYHQE